MVHAQGRDCCSESRLRLVTIQTGSSFPSDSFPPKRSNRRSSRSCHELHKGGVLSTQVTHWDSYWPRGARPGGSVERLPMTSGSSGSGPRVLHHFPNDLRFPQCSARPQCSHRPAGGLSACSRLLQSPEQRRGHPLQAGMGLPSSGWGRQADRCRRT